MRCRAADCVLPPEFLGHEIIILTSDVNILIINTPEAVRIIAVLHDDSLIELYGRDDNR